MAMTDGKLLMAHLRRKVEVGIIRIGGGTGERGREAQYPHVSLPKILLAQHKTGLQKYSVLGFLLL